MFSEYPNDSGYYGSGEPSDDCYDDEDCYSEGSGSGGRSGEDVGDDEDSEDYDSEGSGHHSEQQNNKQDKFEPEWPPWVIKASTAPPEGDIVIEERTSLTPPQFTGAAPALSLSLVFFLLPVIVINLGAELHP